MMTFLIVYGGITLFAAIITLLDLLGRRRQRTHKRSAS
jgi:hypothetical protein